MKKETLTERMYMLELNQSVTEIRHFARIEALETAVLDLCEAVDKEKYKQVLINMYQAMHDSIEEQIELVPDHLKSDIMVVFVPELFDIYKKISQPEQNLFV